MPATPSSDATTSLTSVLVEEFLCTVTNERRRSDARQIITIMRGVSGSEPVMWGPSMIGFGSYHYRYDSGHEGNSFVIGLSPRSAATSVYGLFVDSEQDLLFEKLGPHRLGKGCLYVTRFDAIDHDVFETLVSEAWRRQGFLGA